MFRIHDNLQFRRCPRLGAHEDRILIANSAGGNGVADALPSTRTPSKSFAPNCVVALLLDHFVSINKLPNGFSGDISDNAILLFSTVLKLY